MSHLSPTHRGRISRALMGKPKTPETRQKMSEAKLGIPKSEVHRDNISVAMIGNNNSGRSIVYLLEQFGSVAEAARKFEVSSKTVRRRLVSKNWKSCYYL